MAHEDNSPLSDAEEISVNAPEAVETPADSPRARADEIYRTRSFEGETLRMGQVLRRVRETLGYELDAISAETRLRKDYLMWIERMEVGELPGIGYLRAILNTYARHLGLPAQDVIQAYTAECGGVDEVKNTAPVPKIGEIQRERSKWPLMAAAAAVVVASAASALGVYVMVKPKGEAPATIAPRALAVNGARESLFTEAAATNRPLPKNLALELFAVRQGWLEVRGADGTIFRSRVMAEGEHYFPRLDAGWTVSARDGGAFEWRVGDVSVGALGPDGAPVFSVSVDEQLAKAADMASPAMAANGGTKASR